MLLKIKLIVAGILLAIIGFLKMRNSRLSNKLNKIKVDNLRARADYLHSQSLLAKKAYKDGVKYVENEIQEAKSSADYNPFRDDN